MIIEKEPTFIKVYLDKMPLLVTLPKYRIRLLCALVKRMDSEGNVIITDEVQREIANETHVVCGSISRALLHYHQEDIVAKVDSELYRVNPLIIQSGMSDG